MLITPKTHEVTMARTSAGTKTTTSESAKASKANRSYAGPIVGIAVIAALAALVLLDPPPPGVEFPSQGNTHLAALEEPHPAYNSSPPSSGWHLGLLANWGASEEPIPPELYIHNLEDRGIVFAYNCPDGCEELQSDLTEFVEDEGGFLLLTPYESAIADPAGVEYRAAAVAWKRVFYFDEFDDGTRSELETFISLYQGIDHHAGSGGENLSN
jgi:hypothetical protein